MLSTGAPKAEGDKTITRRTTFEKAFKTKSGCLSGGSLTNRTALELSNKNKEESYTNIYEVLLTYMIDVEMRLVSQEPISFQLSSFGEFFGNFFQ